MEKSSRSLWTEKILNRAKDLNPKDLSLSPYLRKKSEAYQRTLTGVKVCGVILGIDPSLRGTGLSALEAKSDGSIKYIESTTVKNNPKLSMAECLGRIYQETTAIIKRTSPIAVAIEQSVYVQNFKTAMTLGSSRGAVLAAAACAKLKVFEYPPLRIKQAVIGYGRASKEQVARSVAAMVLGAGILPPDESDASAAALTHIFTHKELK